MEAGEGEGIQGSVGCGSRGADRAPWNYPKATVATGEVLFRLQHYR